MLRPVKIPLFLALLVLGCSDSKQPPSSSGSASSTSARPASVTAEMAETFELYVAAFEKLATDIEHASTDCKAILAVVQRDTKDIAALAPRGEKLRDAMKDAKGDRAAGAWFATTYAPRMKAATRKLVPLETKCSGDAELKDAMNAAMQQFPMMRKKS